MVSPCKLASRTKQNPSTPCIIEGVGELQTSWIGQRGVWFILTIIAYPKLIQLFEMEQALAQEGAQLKLVATKKELQVLAVECKRAFEAVGMDHSQHPQVKKALALCSSYVSPSSKPTNKHVTSSTVADLWKQDLCGEVEANALPIQTRSNWPHQYLGKTWCTL